MPVSRFFTLLLLGLLQPIWADSQPEVFSGDRLILDRDGPMACWGKSIGDINGDGRIDLIVGGHMGSRPSFFDRVLQKLKISEYKEEPALVWYENPGWDKHVISLAYPIRTDLEVGDVDQDGVMDVVALSDKGVIWFKGPDWEVQAIVAEKFHDIELADLDHNGELDIVLRNQDYAGHHSGNKIKLLMQQQQGWTPFEISVEQGEGLRVADIDRDGYQDIVIGRFWFQNPYWGTNKEWIPHQYSSEWTWTDTYVDVHDMNDDGWPDILLSPSEPKGELYRLSWFESKSAGTEWQEHMVDSEVETVHHFIGAGDYDGDGKADIFSAEMNHGEGDNEVKVYLARDNNQWQKRVLAKDGSHSMRVADLDGDFDVEVFGAKWQIEGVWENYQIDLWDYPEKKKLWQKHVIGNSGPQRNLFIAAGDLDGDGYEDIAVGPNWYKNPGQLSGPWLHSAIGLGANTAIAIADFNQDKKNDILASAWDQLLADPDLWLRIKHKMLGMGYPGIQPGNVFVWAENDGKGNFTVRDNLDNGAGDFLQGFAFYPNAVAPKAVYLSWHHPGFGIEKITVPQSPDKEPWQVQQITPFSQDEALSLADLDGDSVVDLVTGTYWLNGANPQQKYKITDNSYLPDRNLVADINGDGRSDIVVGYEGISRAGNIAWYENRGDPKMAWPEHIVDIVTGPMSLAAVDMDADGDIDIIVGEHNLEHPQLARLILYENRGSGNNWTPHLLSVGEEHHDGLTVLDLDKDGDLDIISIGWGHSNVTLFENPVH